MQLRYLHLCVSVLVLCVVLKTVHVTGDCTSCCVVDACAEAYEGSVGTCCNQDEALKNTTTAICCPLGYRCSDPDEPLKHHHHHNTYINDNRCRKERVKLPKKVVAEVSMGCVRCCVNGTCEEAFRASEGHCCLYHNEQALCCPGASHDSKCKLDKHSHHLLCKLRRGRHSDDPSLFDLTDDDDVNFALLLLGSFLTAVAIGIPCFLCCRRAVRSLRNRHGEVQHQGQSGHGYFQFTPAYIQHGPAERSADSGHTTQGKTSDSSSMTAPQEGYTLVE
jgi:hypothetical protein